MFKSVLKITTVAAAGLAGYSVFNQRQALADEKRDHGQLRVIFLGPPGSGKGTQAPRLKDQYGINHLATGDMLRAAVREGTELGRKAKDVMARGELVSDDLVIGIIRDTFAKPENSNGFILDGFPRTIPQAEKLDEMLSQQGNSLDKVILFDVRDDTVVIRNAGRLTHPTSGRSYHAVFNPPKVAGVDDITGEPLVQRDDDREEVVRKRLVAYHKSTDPLVDYYRQKGILAVIDAEKPINEVTASLEEILKKH
eukprot:TRINITY_DN973_c0_g1_i1.p1 TRINITY_DN973_c0_g1~~TRINITY_DN973_c0_g1_i1.p1  ORF type:complete len:253 (-),score=113.94 TRINITY_DN973_c0_g1_i1:67-825(-)